jgi:hypothetical protein
VTGSRPEYATSFIGAAMEPMTSQTRFLVVQDAIVVLLRHLDSLPRSDKTEQLQVWVEDCLRETERWREAPPTDRERDVLTKRVLALHVGISTLERELGTVCSTIE